MTPPPTDGEVLERAPLEPPHPRIRARRIEVRRDEGRRRRQRLLGLVAILGLATVLALVARSPLFSIEHVTVVGNSHTSEAAIVAAAHATDGKPMMDFSASAASTRVAALPWIDDVSVRRHWPHSVSISVTERQPLAEVVEGGRWAVLDRSGRVLALDAHHVTGLVTLVGVSAGQPGSRVSAAGLSALGLAQDLKLELPGRASKITAAFGDLSVHLPGANPIEVAFGPATQLNSKVQSLAAVLAGAAPGRPIATIDVSVPSAPVLTRQPGAST